MNDIVCDFYHTCAKIHYNVLNMWRKIYNLHGLNYIFYSYWFKLYILQLLVYGQTDIFYVDLLFN
jgi:hypothetical protein